MILAAFVLAFVAFLALPLFFIGRVEGDERKPFIRLHHHH